MNITEVNIKLIQSPNSRLRAFCTLTLNDEIVIRDVKIIEGTKGPFVAMPSRKLMDRCPKCSTKNHLRSRFCNNCAAELRPDRAGVDDQGRPRLHVDVAHPINSESRATLQEKVLEAFHEEVERSGQPDYQPDSVAPDMDYDVYGEASRSKTTSSSETPQEQEPEKEQEQEQEQEQEKEQEKEEEEKPSSGFGEGIL